MAASSRFLKSTLMEFLLRTDPASSIAKPACMKNTRMPQIITQPSSRFMFSVPIASSKSA
ncbi:hypothetical protein B484DRAFT_456822 [Ochromonadaceae sp. CCMP2298]|nr:hypothetical protein B484DRAFT_456822 [Ochromonadaceae sp. CCMP2298]